MLLIENEKKRQLKKNDSKNKIEGKLYIPIIIHTVLIEIIAPPEF